MRHGLVAVMVLVVAAAWAVTANPLESARVGDWVETKAFTDTLGQVIEQTKRREVVGKDDKTITIRTRVTNRGVALAPTEVTFFLDQVTPPLDDGLGSEILEEGDETLLVGSRALACRKVRTRFSLPLQMASGTAIQTTWTSTEVPLCPTIKTVIEKQVGKTTTTITETLIDFGGSR